MSILPEKINTTEETVAEETAAEKVNVEVTEPVEEKTTAEETAVEETAAPIEEDGRQFFAYDQDYARKKKTYAQPVHKFIAIVLVLIAAFLLAFIPILVLPTDSLWAMLTLCLGFLLALFGLFVVPSFFKYKLNAWFKSFITDGDNIWMFRFYPYVARTKAEAVRGMQQDYNNACYDISHDKDTVSQILDIVREGKRPASHNKYSKVKYVCMGNVKVVKEGKNAKVSYTNAKNKTKTTKIADCYPGLFEYINKL